MQRVFFTWKPEKNMQLELLEEWVENKFGVSLPDDFLGFISSNGVGSSPIPGRFSGKIGMDHLIIEEFYWLSPVEDTYSIQYKTENAIDEGWMSDDLIMFARGGSGHLCFILAVKGPHRGKVFAFVDSGVYLEGDQIRLENGALHLADTFSEFIDGLYADEVNIENWEDSMGYLPNEIKEKFGFGS
ncbi:SMI1 / KNR4 family protein [Pseudovibrio sp. W64]|uniref:SMI1/KNR4 family protein n=1 Tax=Pseudovibrio sp. W64 TaxID=1735583 RepID=UPI0007AE856A|nr:SMI1/KNR4 family protein [Pseudovibrio sp. W64]KZK78004.1 SMI1 / KNR4 family protein [Pseudovibrio sp. W64]